MIIGLCGKKQHGKNTVARILTEEFGFVELAFADGVRKLAEATDPLVDIRPLGTGCSTARYSEVLANYGYEQAKQLPDVRRLLQRIGTEGGRQVLGPDVWVNALSVALGKLDTNSNVAVTDVRFPNEAEFILNIGGALVRVERPGMPDDADTHESERHALTMPASSVIENKGTIDDLRAQVRQLYAASVEGGF